MKDLPRSGPLQRVLYALPALVSAGAVFYVSSLSKIYLPLESLSFNDLIFHGLAYFFFGLTLAIAAYPQHRSFDFPRNTLIALFVIGILYGLSDEIHQSFVPNRTCSVSDVMADAAGILLSLLSVKILFRGRLTLKKVKGP